MEGRESLVCVTHTDARPLVCLSASHAQPASAAHQRRTIRGKTTIWALFFPFFFYRGGSSDTILQTQTQHFIWGRDGRASFPAYVGTLSTKTDLFWNDLSLNGEMCVFDGIMKTLEK